jgi:hypothetical protein
MPLLILRNDITLSTVKSVKVLPITNNYMYIGTLRDNAVYCRTGKPVAVNNLLNVLLEGQCNNTLLANECSQLSLELKMYLSFTKRFINSILPSIAANCITTQQILG